MALRPAAKWLSTPRSRDNRRCRRSAARPRSCAPLGVNPAGRMSRNSVSVSPVAKLLAQFGFMPAALTRSEFAAISLSINASNSFGDISMGSTPSADSFPCTADVFSAFAVSSYAFPRSRVASSPAEKDQTTLKTPHLQDRLHASRLHRLATSSTPKLPHSSARLSATFASFDCRLGASERCRVFGNHLTTKGLIRRRLAIA